MPAKTGLDALLRPEDSILVLIDHQPYQFTNLNSHEPTMIVNNVIGLAKTQFVDLAPGVIPVAAARVAQAYKRSILGAHAGQIYKIRG
jgi:hypothetical protein